MGLTRSRRNSAGGSVTVKIVEEVAERKGVDPVELTPPLHAAIDSEALESLFSDSISGANREGIRVTFTYCGYNILVDEEGEVEIRDE